MGTGLYLFCFARPDLAAAPEGTGVEGSNPIVVERFAAASAVVSEVPLAEFCGPQAEAHLEELAWLGPRACRHERVIEEVMSQSPVLPVRFGTIFSTRARLEDFVGRHACLISGFFERVAGQEEWAVKGLLDRAKAAQSASAEELAARGLELEALSPGRRHLEEQRLRAAADNGLHRRVLEAGRAVADDLSRLAPAFAQRRIVAPGGADATAEVVFNWAFLLPREQRASFRAQVERANDAYAGQGLGFALSGPWPPYSFVPALSMGDDV